MEDSPSVVRPLGRRNLPRASHACQRCRTKKGRCNQQQPCSTCIRAGSACVYGERRKRTKNTDSRLTSESLEHDTEIQASYQTGDRPVSTRYTAANVDDTVSESDTSPAANMESVRSDETMTPGNRDVIGDVNQRTQGTEFYGTSSNYVLLNQLFSHARLHSHARHDSTSASSAAVAPASDQNQNTPNNRISLVNLLANEDDLLPPSREKSPSNNYPSTAWPSISNALSGVADTSPAVQQQIAEKRLEKALIRSFMHNLHYLHPMIDSNIFYARYNELVTESSNPPERSPHLRHFFALYNIVVAVGALVASVDLSEEYAREITVVLQSKKDLQELAKAPLQRLSRLYFRKSRSLLGDVFEACSLESAQALLLMSLYCQNSLKPHACYMYCGMAVRTALAIGLPSESMSGTVESCKAARRTWWCIYSHEIDMCCSAGRFDSLGKPRKYSIPLPKIKTLDADSNADTAELEESSVSMVTVMVDFAVVLRRISKDIYHSSKDTTISQKSSIAFAIDNLLDEWKLKLPSWHRFDAVNFREAEWAAKQKLVLHLRYLNARVILHRPFLSDPVAFGLPGRQKHVDLCLSAARKTIQVIYDSYANRHYFRTWWYNSTYTLYAGMIVLYVIMLGNSTIPNDVLLEDVKKSRDILRSMEEASVARRSADLLGEVLDVAIAYTQQKQNNASGVTAVRDAEGAPENSVYQPISSSTVDFAQSDFIQDPEAFMASLIDPNILQEFTTDSNDWAGLEFPSFPLYDAGHGLHDSGDNFFSRAGT
ncbi:hypothetical protein D6D11_07995 [Aureobasidium pullulans]|nr:hypothetical protein D6D11_07995 [Aureobasidium pullulans]